MRKADSSGNDSELVLVKVLYSESETEIVQSLLKAFGVDCIVGRDDCGNQRPSLSFVEGMRLFVRAEDAALAQEILASEAAEG